MRRLETRQSDVSSLRDANSYYAGNSLMTDTLFLNYADVMHRTTLSRLEIEQLIREGAFVEPVEIAPEQWAWREADIDAWIESLPIAEADAMHFTEDTFETNDQSMVSSMVSKLKPK